MIVDKFNPSSGGSPMRAKAIDIAYVHVAVDHHTLFLLQGPGSGLQHAAFEVHDWDDLMLGHDALEGGGYSHHWGVGKHILGSQVFDYWHDPFGNTMEHFTDGDLFDNTREPGLAAVQSLLAVQWGDRMQPPG